MKTPENAKLLIIAHIYEGCHLLLKIRSNKTPASIICVQRLHSFFIQHSSVDSENG